MPGDPSSALLEVLDPEQNDTFSDHYLEIPYNLSNVMFIATANVGDTIPEPLRDRMEIIEIPGYTRLEKLAIARRHLVPKQLREHGIGAERLEITDEALALVIDRYTREAGVRSLEKQHRDHRPRGGRPVRRGRRRGGHRARRGGPARLPRAGAARRPARSSARPRPGVATGLAWTPVGGEILFVEATRMPGSGKLTLTGQLGDVMKESAMAALSYVRANTARRSSVRHPAGLPRQERHPHPRPRGRDAQGRAQRRRDAGLGAGLGPDRDSRAPRRGDDRRDHAARAGAAHRRAQGEGARRAPGGHQARHRPGAERGGPRRGARRGEARDRVRLRLAHRRGHRRGARRGRRRPAAAPAGGRGPAAALG